MPRDDRAPEHEPVDLRKDRPALVVVVTGTATEVGKTWVTARVAEELRSRGMVVAARKPAQSHDPGDLGTDAATLAAATGEEAHAVCRGDRDFAVPMAPPMAAAALGRAPFSVADLVAELQWPGGCDVGLVETAGGVRSPIAADGDCLELMEQVGPEAVVLVADAGLGVINAVRLCVGVLGRARTIVVLNRFDATQDLHRRNLAWLRDVDGLDPVISPVDLAHVLVELHKEMV